MENIPDDIYELISWYRTQGNEITFFDSKTVRVNGEFTSLGDLLDKIEQERDEYRVCV